VPAALRLDFASEGDPLAALAAFVEIATPVFCEFGYAPEEKHPKAARDWMHWNRGPQDVIRAYAFSEGNRGGVSVTGQGEIPEGLAEAVIRRMAESTGWDVIRSS
jgi:hypothetical protein